MKTFLILNGPNLGYVGKRQPEIYGSDKIEDIPEHLKTLMGDKAEEIQLEFFSPI